MLLWQASSSRSDSVFEVSHAVTTSSAPGAILESFTGFFWVTARERSMWAG